MLLYFFKFSFQRNPSLSMPAEIKSSLSLFLSWRLFPLTLHFFRTSAWSLPLEQPARMPGPYKDRVECHSRSALQGEERCCLWRENNQLKSHLKAWNLKWISPVLLSKKGNGKGVTVGMDQSWPAICHPYAFYFGEWQELTVWEFSKFKLKATVYT